MKILNRQELETILNKHGKWLRDDPEGERADLSYTDLSSADLRSACLSSANFSFADLSFANFSFSDLSSANFSSANLHSADLRSSDLRSANFSSAKLSSADLRSACLSSANFSFADLSSVNFSSANFSSVNFSGADLRSANLVIFQSSRHQAFYTSDGTLRIGCETMSIADWSEFYEEIGLANDYSQMNIIAYGGFIKSCLEIFNETYPKCEQNAHW